MGTSIGEAVKAKNTADAIKAQHELQKAQLNERMDDNTFDKIRSGNGIKKRMKNLRL